MAGEAMIAGMAQQQLDKGIGAIGGFIEGYYYAQEAKRLKKERERLLKEGAPGLSDIEKKQLERAEKRAEQPLSPEELQQYAASQARAASSLAPGYSQEIEGIAQQQADVLAAGKRGAATSSNLLNLLGRMNMQGQAARRALAMRGEQAQRAAQDVLGRQTSYVGGVRRGAQQNLENLSMLSDARREQRKRLWEAQLAQMDKTAREYKMAAVKAPIQGYLGQSGRGTTSIPSSLGGRQAVDTSAGSTGTTFLGPSPGMVGEGYQYDYVTGQYVDPVTGLPQ